MERRASNDAGDVEGDAGGAADAGPLTPDADPDAGAADACEEAIRALVGDGEDLASAIEALLDSGQLDDIEACSDVE